jgi:hypothetical protein
MLQTVRRLLTLFLLICLWAGAQAQQTTTPKQGSPERKAIVDALRVPMQKRLKQKIIFKIDRLKLKDGFAFIVAQPLQPNGRPIDYRGTSIQSAIDAGAFDDTVVALLKRQGGRWKVLTYVHGATDVPYVDWPEKYKAPPAIFKVD